MEEKHSMGHRGNDLDCRKHAYLHGSENVWSMGTEIQPSVDDRQRNHRNQKDHYTQVDPTIDGQGVTRSLAQTPGIPRTRHGEDTAHTL
jgi:hypothetical protein